MRIPYGFNLTGSGTLEINQSTVDVVQNIFNYYMSGASLGKVVDGLYAEQIPSPTGKPRWTRAAVDHARERGASKIIVVGGTESRLELCREAGADFVINRNNTNIEERLQIVQEITGGRGANAVFEVTGTAAAVEEGLHYVATSGSYISAGIAVDVGNIKVNWFSEIVRKNVTIKGIWVGDIKNTWQAIELYRRKKEILDRMITHRIPLSNATQALQMMERREGIKIALIP